MKEFMKGFLIGVWNGLAIIGLLALILALCGCSNNYLERRSYLPCKENGYKLSEYKAGRQSLFVNSSWDVAAVRLDPNNVSMRSERILSDPERIHLVTPWGVIEGGNEGVSNPQIPASMSEDTDGVAERHIDPSHGTN